MNKNIEITTIYIIIADITCRIRVNKKRLMRLFKREYHYSIDDQKYEIDIFISYDKNQYSFLSSSLHKNVSIVIKDIKSFREIDFITMGLIAFHLVFYKIILLHASSFVKNDKGYLFLGSSGSGKSTILKQVKTDQKFSDDTAILKKIKNKFYIFSSPFDKKKVETSINKNFEISSIFMIKQSLRTKWINMSYHSKFNDLIKNNVYFDFCSYFYYLNTSNKVSKHERGIFSKDSNVNTNIYKLLFELVEKVTIRKLFFTKKITFLSYL